MGSDGLHFRTWGRALGFLDPIGQGRFIIAGVDGEMMDWVVDRIPAIDRGYRWDKATAIGLASAEGILAGMVVHDYCKSTRSCQITFAARSAKWATRHSIAAMMRYPFIQLGCRRLTTITAASNTRALRFNEGIGFKREGVIRYGMGDEDAIMCGLLIEETPEWLGLR